MDEQERLQVLELRDRVVCGLGGLSSFQALNPHPYVSGQDHVHVIRPISNSKGRLLGVLLPHDLHYLCFLLRRCPAGKDDLHLLSNFYEFPFEVFPGTNLEEGLSTYNHSMRLFPQHENISFYFLNLFQDLKSCFPINYKPVNVIRQKASRVSNINGCFYLIPCQHPDFNPCLLQTHYCILYVFL
jgi:hypothetical protein